MRIAIVGLPNAGKSSLFNKLVKQLDRAVVSSSPHTTRDWKEACSKQGWLIIDTPGIASFQQPSWWIGFSADIYIWMHDSSRRCEQIDFEIADWLRKTDKPVILCLNKCDLPTLSDVSHGFKTQLLSTKTNSGFPQLRSSIHKFDSSIVSESSHPPTPKPTPPPQLIILGQPNAGKSSLCNALHGSSRVVISATPGTTVDTIILDTPIGTIKDTPGLKRRKYKGYMSDAVVNLRRQLECFRGVILYAIDASQPLVSQDLRLAKLAWDTGNPVLLLLNKYDLAPARNEPISPEWLKSVQRIIPGAEPLKISALQHTNLDKLQKHIELLQESWSRVISTNLLNKWSAGLRLASRAVIKYVSQPETCPPTLYVSGRHLQTIDLRFIARKFREDFNLPAIPVRIGKKIY